MISKCLQRPRNICDKIMQKNSGVLRRSVRPTTRTIDEHVLVKAKRMVSIRPGTDSGPSKDNKDRAELTARCGSRKDPDGKETALGDRSPEKQKQERIIHQFQTSREPRQTITKRKHDQFSRQQDEENN
ncbi:hypothetical protein T265_03622 [Opisthorchis viverrini]|uniref:Uncharacterized protein n=1 Tax=Opisthorchis viverrini TaxID=6198 RepID=A0A074ZQZ0_OPIVI|nr:hypothetical protein T265_03622 [Opisthorchis viverrini]KER29828.1 hypothetical protein T265_03622 [Opisthorchis viverrini]